MGGLCLGALSGVLLAVALAVPGTAAGAADLPDWAYPVTPPPKPVDAVRPVTLPGSARSYTQAEIDDGFNPPDWYPGDHPPMPEVVAHGRKEAGARGCAQCHLTSGGGHPESAGISGLPAGYFVRQMLEFRSGARKGPRATAMIPIARGMTEDDFRAAAAYYEAIAYPAWYRVVETDTVPKSYLGNGAMRFPVEGGGTEPLGNRIIELPQNDVSAESRDPRTGFVAYVPAGSIGRGAEIVATGAGRTVPCAVCHGAGLKGVSEVPPITGRSPMYVYRQLNDIRSGTRAGLWTPLMKGVVDRLEDADMIAIAAYLAAREP